MRQSLLSALCLLLLTAGAGDSPGYAAVTEAPALTGTAAEEVTGAGLIRSFSPWSLIRTDGSLWVWGGYHRTVPTEQHAMKDVAASFGLQYAASEDGIVQRWSFTKITPDITFTPVEGPRGLQAVMRGGREDYLLDLDGIVYRYVPADDGAAVPAVPLEGMGRMTAMSGVYDFTIGDRVDLFLAEDGTVWTLTRQDGLSRIPGLDRIVAIKQYYALREDGTVWRWSAARRSDPNETTADVLNAVRVESLPPMAMIASLRGGYAGVDAEGGVWFWGETVTGETDTTAFHEQPAPVRLTAISDAHRVYLFERSLLVLTKDGDVYETSIGGTRMEADRPFKRVAQDIIRIEAANRHVIMLKRDGTLWGYGVNKEANLGYGDLVFMHPGPVQVHNPIQLRLNGQPVAMRNGAIIRDGHAYVPLRSVFEQLGAEVTWHGADRTAAVSRPASEGRPAVMIEADYNIGELRLNGETVDGLEPMFMNGGSAYLPLRFISERLGAAVDWDAQQRRIAIRMD